MLSRIFDLAIDTEKGKIVGFLLAPVGNKVVAPVDVVSWGSQLVVSDSEDILEIDEIQAVIKVLTRNIPIYRNRVYTKDGLYLGRVINFAVHAKMLTLTKIVVAKRFLGIRHGRLIINSKDIIEINKDSIVVRNLIDTVSIKKLSPDMAPTV